MNKYFIGIFGGVLVLVGLGVLVGYQLKKPVQNLSSVARAGEYQSTTFTATTTAYTLFKTGSGTLGNVVINVLGTGSAVFYDTTTTNANLRGSVATSSLRKVGVIAASQAAGTYIYDNNFFNGLLVEFNGTQGTSTIMWR